MESGTFYQGIWADVHDISLQIHATWLLGTARDYQRILPLNSTTGGELRDLEDATNAQPRLLRRHGFGCFTNLALGDIISMLKHAIDLTPQGHPAKHSRPNNLAGSMFEESSHPDKPMILNNPGSLILQLFTYYYYM
ncbi:hypothetical protein EV363DRAFT_1178458 [Boletus edulis]|uniref:Uncharacterized protein n=1 Tax=Boletus edulis BED1 TaxID=1328754 RepID=A0AAD4BLW5_BOLED|nr:hypothetical protein EV363DRAFT_1230820 [Boletus edulis]KAF8124044.1 hypothetical protein EV363DRAFT_1178458 [Boletus edulis]KAF8433760.1 hypothetical protein L210DRAFT_3649563 [Boletus edulis BED1]